MVFSVVFVKLVKSLGTHSLAISNVSLCWMVWHGHCKFGLFASMTRIALASLMLIWHWIRVRASIGNSFLLRMITKWSHSNLNGTQMMAFVWRSHRAQFRWLSLSFWTDLLHWCSTHCFRLLSTCKFQIVTNWKRDQLCWRQSSNHCLFRMMLI